MAQPPATASGLFATYALDAQLGDSIRTAEGVCDGKEDIDAAREETFFSMGCRLVGHRLASDAHDPHSSHPAQADEHAPKTAQNADCMHARIDGNCLGRTQDRRGLGEERTCDNGGAKEQRQVQERRRDQVQLATIACSMARHQKRTMRHSQGVKNGQWPDGELAGGGRRSVPVQPRTNGAPT